MSETTVLDDLTEIFREVFLRDELELQRSDSAANVAGWDSFKHLEIIMAVEERFEIKLSTREVDALQTVGDLVDIIARKTGRSA